MSCKKCNSPKTVTLRNKDYYCNNCFMITTNHKFRACLGKNKILSPNENVLICLSGGKASTVLLDLVHHGISLENTKKLRIVPFFLHLYGNDTNPGTTAKSLLECCKKYNFDVYIAHLSDYLNSSNDLPKVNCMQDVDKDAESRFQEMLKSMPPTAANDFLLKIKRTLFVKYAKLLQCNVVFTAETTNTLAINLLSNLAIGRGSQVHNDIGFCDIRDGKVKIIRPMKDVSKEELDYYVSIKSLQPINNSNLNNNSLQSVISSFVCDLQENFQSTISTVCKTADKIGDHSQDMVQEKCLLCESELCRKNFKMSALEATNISRTISLSNDSTKEVSTLFEPDNLAAVFPFVHKNLCYGCSRNHSEMNQLSLPIHLQEILNP